MPSGAAAPDRAEQITERAVAEEVERLVGHFEVDGPGGLSVRAALAAPLLAFPVEVGGLGDEALFHQLLDELLDQVLELLARALLVAVGRLAEQPVELFVGEHASREECFEDGVVQRLHRAVDRKSTRLNSSHTDISRMPSSA